MTLNKVKYENINQVIKIKGTIAEIKPPEPVVTVASYKCKSCDKTHHKKQDIHGDLKRPLICQDCGSRLFELDPENCGYTEKQELTVYCDKRVIKIYLRGNLCGYNYKRLKEISVEGFLRVKLESDKPNWYYLEVTSLLKS